MKRDIRRYANRRQYLINAVKERRRRLRQKAIDYKGARRHFCGYAKCVGALEFHHEDPRKKDFGISAKGYTRSWSGVKS